MHAISDVLYTGRKRRKRFMYVYGVLVDLLFHVVYYSKLSPIWGARLC